MSSHAQGNKDMIVQEMQGQDNKIQAERIADQFSEISQIYSPLKTEDINIDNLCDDRPLPQINPYIVYTKIMCFKKKTSTVLGDIPMKLIKFCAEELSFPLSDIYSRALSHGEYPDIYKLEIVTPVPKCYPAKTTKDLRKIAGTQNFSRIFEKILAEVMIEDMRPTRDPFQYGNSK